MTDTEAMTLGKNLKGSGEAKAKGLELIHQSIRKKQEAMMAVGMDWNPSVSIHESEGEHPRHSSATHGGQTGWSPSGTMQGE